MAEWYFRLAGHELGPIAARELAAMALDGRLQPSDQVRRSDKTAWVEAARIQGLQFPTQGPPPMPRPVSPVIAPLLVAIPVESENTMVVRDRGVLAEIKRTASATLLHATAAWELLLLRFRPSAQTRELEQARLAVGREMFDSGIGPSARLQTIREILRELSVASPTQAKALSQRRDDEFVLLASQAQPEQLGGLPSLERLKNSLAAQSALESQLAQQREAFRRPGERNRVWAGYGVLGLAFVSIAMLFWSGDLLSENKGSRASGSGGSIESYGSTADTSSSSGYNAWQDLQPEAYRRGLGNGLNQKSLLLYVHQLLREEGRISRPSGSQVFRTLDVLHPGWNQLPPNRVEFNIRTTATLAKSTGQPLFSSAFLRSL